MMIIIARITSGINLGCTQNIIATAPICPTS